jgi:hypothetical protein
MRDGSALDNTAGAIVEALQRARLFKSTVIIFTSDKCVHLHQRQGWVVGRCSLLARCCAVTTADAPGPLT